MSQRSFILGVLAMLLFASWYEHRKDSSTPPASTTTTTVLPIRELMPPAAKAQAAEARAAAMDVSVEAVDKFQAMGAITTWTPATGECFVRSSFWQGLTYQHKHDFVKAVSLARQAVRNLPQVTIRDAQTGHELASFGVFAGVTIR